MRYLFYLAHPAQFHLFKNTMTGLSNRGHAVHITIKSKDVLEDLVKESGMPYSIVSKRERKNGKTDILLGLIERNTAHFRICKKWKPDVFISTSAEFAPIAKLLGIPCVSFFEDDLEIFPLYSRIFIPFLKYQICPESCSAGIWEHHPKTIKYRGNHELAYLRPESFHPVQEKVKALFDSQRKNFILRFSKLNAWHDDNIHGIDNRFALQIINAIEPYGRVFISSERVLPPELEKYRIKIKASDMLDYLYFSDMFIGDSQTMTAEAAVLGTPALRCNDFVGKLGYLKQLEDEFNLCFGFRTDQKQALIEKAAELASANGLKKEWKFKREELLKNTIDPTIFFVWFLENYPQSARSKELAEKTKPCKDKGNA